MKPFNSWLPFDNQSSLFVQSFSSKQIDMSIWFFNIRLTLHSKIKLLMLEFWWNLFYIYLMSLCNEYKNLLPNITMNFLLVASVMAIKNLLILIATMKTWNYINFTSNLCLLAMFVTTSNFVLSISTLLKYWFFYNCQNIGFF